MRERGNLAVLTAEAEEFRLPPADTEPETQTLRSSAAQLAISLAWMPGKKESSALGDRCRPLSRLFEPVFAAVESQAGQDVSGDFRLFHQAAFLLEADLEELCGNVNPSTNLPQVRTRSAPI